MKYIRLLRPHQYTKNIFTFAPFIFSVEFTFDKFLASFIAFALFSLLASSIYIINDYMDIEEDRAHPTKKNRPLASGAVSEKVALILMSFLSIFVGVVSFRYNTNLFAILAIYFVLNIAYSLKLKHIVIVDVFIIATGFVLRLFAGSIAADIKLSMWIIILTFLLALFLAFAKRRDDVLLSGQGKQTRKNIEGYNLEFVNAAMVLMSGVILVSYIMYSVSMAPQIKQGGEYLYLTSFFVLLGIIRYLKITFVNQNSGNPTRILAKDRFTQIIIICWLTSYIYIVKFL
ncbi:MAG: prenyltransferase [Hyphomicrobiales bacterium]|nr:MAG: prenyltransferase [Hyphomicrobiales bacterium]